VSRSIMATRLSVLASLVFAGGCFTAAPASNAQGDGGAALAKCSAPETADRLADQVLQLVNLERGEADLPPVVLNPSLSKIADDYACRMIENDFFGHRDPAGGHGPGERAIAGRYAFYAIGENLAAGQETPTEVMKVWMQSPSHRAIILDERWTEIGISVRHGGKHGIYWVQEFGDPARFNE
jgi:uncharacterized protein YkwD